MKNVTWKEHKKELLKDKILREEYERLGPEFEVARQIIQLRLKKGLTQKELARIAHTNQVVISRLENGEANPSLGFMKKVFGALGKDIHVIAK